MAVTLNPDGFGTIENAQALAAACQIAYYPADKGSQAFQDELGMTARLISVDNTQAYLAHNSENIVVAFRGSEGPNSIDGLKDWLLTNALNLLITPEGELSTEFIAAGVGARFHQGFVSAITEIWPELYPAVKAEFESSDRPLWVTGHSLGGALALLGGWLFKRKFLPVHQIVTFGAPMVGNQEVAAAFDREFPNMIFRYVNGPDPVPLLPMMSLVSNDFAHCERLLVVGDAEMAHNLLAYLRETAGGIVEGILSGDIQEKVWDAIKDKVAAHMLGDYRKFLS